MHKDSVYVREVRRAGAGGGGGADGLMDLDTSEGENGHKKRNGDLVMWIDDA
jgi:hypothetical protein